MNSQPSFAVNEVNFQCFFRTLFLAVFAASFTPLWPLLTSGSSLPSLIQCLVPWWIFPQSWQYLIFVTSLFFMGSFWALMAPPGAVKSQDWKQYSYSADQVIYSFHSCYYIHLPLLVSGWTSWIPCLPERKKSKKQDFFSLSNLQPILEL